LVPNLGVMSYEDPADSRTLVIADIPGLIEGASEGHGLGIQFLRHVERTRLLVHLVDVSESSGRDPVEDFHIVLRELARFSADLAAKPMIVVASKIDAAQDPERVRRLEEAARGAGYDTMRISAVTGEGLGDLKAAIFERAYWASEVAALNTSGNPGSALA
jgi:GTP-binding protein